MLYGLGASSVVGPAMAALPPCLSQELLNCLDHDNVDGLPKAECDAITKAYAKETSDADYNIVNDAVNALPVCKQPVAAYAGVGFAAGVLLTVILVKSTKR